MAKNKYLNKQLPPNASKGHRKIALILEELLPHFNIVYEFSCKKAAERKGVDASEYGVENQYFDFYIIELEMAVEYQGEQHYTEGAWGSGTIERDKRKRRFCEDIGIDLVEIPYDKNIGKLTVKELLGI